MSRQTFQETLFCATSSGAAVATTTAETVLFPNVTIPANYMQDSRVLRLTIFGDYGTTGTPTLQFRLRWGGVSGTVLCATAAATLTSGVGGGASMTAPFGMSALIQVRSNGATGTAMTNGRVELFTSTAPTAGTVTNYGLVIPLASGSTGGTTPAVATCDFTTDTAFAVTAQWGTSNAANSVQGLNYLLESVN